MNTLLIATLLCAAPAPLFPPDAGGPADAGVGPTRLSPYRIDLPVEVAALASSASLFLIADYLIKPSLEGDVSCLHPIGADRCDPADLSAVDRYAVGRRSTQWQLVSDVMLYVSAAAPIVYLALESLVLPTDHPVLDFTQDVLVVSEAIGVTAALQIALKFLWRRPRPVRYQPVDVPLAAFDDELSLPSGHVTLVSSATTALTTTLFLRHPDSRLRYPVLAAGALMTLLTAIGRVENGRHFPTDVSIGVLLGTISGFLVPYFHRKNAAVRPVATFDPGTGFAHVGLSGTF